jgi:GT2 family glycosyltransferase
MPWSRDNDIKLEPVRSIRVVEGVHESLGSRPAFSVVSDRLPLPSGWCRISYRGHSARGYLSPKLHIQTVDCGESNVLIELPPSRGQLVTAIRRLPARVARMHLSPIAGPGRFWIDDFRIGQLKGRAMVVEIARRSLRQLIADPFRLGAWGRIAWRIWRGGNLNSLKIFVARWLEQSELDYRIWVSYHDNLTDVDRAAIRSRIAGLRPRITFSIVIRVDNTVEWQLRRCLDSVMNQIYTDWELSVVYDALSAPYVYGVLEEYSRRDRRIRVASALTVTDSTDDYVILLEPHGTLSEHALYLIGETLNGAPGLDLVYADDDAIDPSGARVSPYFKGNWDAERFLQQDYLSHFCALRKTLMLRVGGWRTGYEGSESYDLVLRCMAESKVQRVGHLPFVLYHAQLGAADLLAARSACEPRLRALTDHLRVTGANAKVERSAVAGVFRIRHPLPEPAPRVSLIIPTRNGAELVRRCIESIVARTSYVSYEILLVDNESDESSATAYFRELHSSGIVHLIRFDGPFNYAAINNFAARHATGGILGLLNNDTEVFDGEWLSEMVAYATRPEIGAVGAKLLYPDGTIQHAGIVMGLHGTVGHLLQRSPSESAGYCSCLTVAREVTAVTGACLLVRRSVYEEVGGLDEKNLPVAFNDIDFCLELRSRGYRNIWTPHAVLYHHEGATRGPDDSSAKAARFSNEWAHMREKWGRALDDDPFYSPNLSLASDDCSPSFPPRCEVPWSRDERLGGGAAAAPPDYLTSLVRTGR